MAVVLLVVLYLLAAVESRALGTELMCRDGLEGMGCRCDTLCALYGDCCSDAPSFVPEDQRRGASPFICDNSDVYMMSSCPADWDDSYTRYHCEHPDTSYQDPVFDVPVTSNRTNITYHNRHCAWCHRDLDAGTTDIWSVNFTCPDVWLKVASDELIRHLVYNTATSSWVLNMTAHPGLLIFDNPKASTLVYNCTVGVEPTDLARKVMRTCNSSTVDTCPEDWTDEDVLTQCEAYTAHVCANGTVYRNHYCERCNNNGSFHNLGCHMFGVRIATEKSSPDFSLLLNWHSLKERDTCQQDTEQYDPFKKTCRTAFIATENLVLHNHTMASTNATSNSSLDTCWKFRLEPHEFYIEDNDTMAVFISAYNMTLEPQDYRIDNDSRLVMCMPEFMPEFETEFAHGIRYITIIGVSMSILFLVLHLSVFAMTPKLRNLSSMNLASLSVSLLVMYCSFFVGFYLRNSSVMCVIMAVIIHYTLLASFCWMLTIAYDINKVLRQTTTKLLLTRGKHWQRFGIYSLWSWTLPAAVVGAALAANFSTDQVLEFLRPVYGDKQCYISNYVALLIFTVGPLLVIMVLNNVLFFWSACLIRTTRSELYNATTTHTNFHLYARLALIMGLTWAVGLVAGYLDSLVLWYVFVILNTLQGLFIFLAFTCTKKVCHGLRVQLGMQLDRRQSQSPKSAVNTVDTST